MCAGLAFSFSRVPNKLSLIAVVSHPPTEMMGLKLKSNSFQERSLKLRGELVTGIQLKPKRRLIFKECAVSPSIVTT
ncbi:hypothetical protein Y1Q_0022815 [Alligator mississippiensis]|uniref:Uncharacterized protein n=1 Tax=Alligator mississippiensis TaxID=8496 RepID=A0A151N4P4_ALLMI|nr:hypothetical protein Y1Q_0022815 [Alligator mississippiensis]